jgi:hypothetical protein
MHPPFCAQCLHTCARRGAFIMWSSLSKSNDMNFCNSNNLDGHAQSLSLQCTTLNTCIASNNAVIGLLAPPTHYVDVGRGHLSYTRVPTARKNAYRRNHGNSVGCIKALGTTQVHPSCLLFFRIQPMTVLHSAAAHHASFRSSTGQDIAVQYQSASMHGCIQ